jgi:hypothetical protein
MTLKRIRVLAIVAALLMSLSAFAGEHVPFQNDPPGDPGAGGSCSYCGQAHCGCATMDGYYISYFYCACTSSECTQTCEYTHT